MVGPSKMKVLSLNLIENENPVDENISDGEGSERLNTLNSIRSTNQISMSINQLNLFTDRRRKDYGEVGEQIPSEEELDLHAIELDNYQTDRTGGKSLFQQELSTRLKKKI